MAQRLAISIDEPNLVLSLASSLNQRGVAGFNAVNASQDQIKINSIYKPVTNAMTGQRTVYLAKRPGAQLLGSGWGVSSQTNWLWEVAPGATSNTSSNYRIFATSGTTTNYLSATSTTLVTSIAGYVPTFVDKTHLSGVENLVVQLRHTSNFAQLVFFTTSGAFTQITDGDFPTTGIKGKMEFMDGYAFAMTSTNTIINSDLNTVSTYTATNFIRKQIQQDIPVGLGRLGNQIIGWGAGTMEVFRNAGLPSGSPLETIPQLAQRVGMVAIDNANKQSYYSELGKRIYWHGTNPNGVYAYDGGRVEKVSTPPVDAVLNDQPPTSVCTISFSGQNAVAFSVHNRTQSTAHTWMLFFPEWNDWFFWNSAVFQPITNPRVTDTFMGISASTAHMMFQMSFDTDNWFDNGSIYTMTHRFKVPANSARRKVLHMLGVIGDTEPTTTTSNLNVIITKDDWQTTTAIRNIDLTSVRKTLYRFGSFRDLGVIFQHSANSECRLEKFIARIE